MGYMFPSSRVASGNYSLRAFVNPSSQTELSLRASPTIVTATVWAGVPQFLSDFDIPFSDPCPSAQNIKVRNRFSHDWL